MLNVMAAGKNHVLALVDEHRLQVEAQMNRVDAARNALHIEEKQCRSLQRRLYRLYSFIAPFHRLPYELIGEIASLCVEQGRSPWELVRICRAWRAACFGTPRLWGGLRIVLSPKSSLTARYHDGKENCFSIKQFDEAMERSGAAPLHLEFDSSRCYGWLWRVRAEKRQPTIDHIISVLSSRQEIARVKSLSVSIDRRTETCKIDDQFFTGPFPALEHISIIKPDAAHFLSRTQLVDANWAPRLHSAAFLESTAWAVNKLKWIERLTSLTIDWSNNPWPVHDYPSTLDKTKLLTALTLIGIGKNRWRSGTKHVELPCLRELEVRASSLRWMMFKTPLLEKLMVEKTDWTGSKVTGDPTIARLKEINWAGLQKDYILRDIRADSVDLVSLDFWNGGGFPIIFPWDGGGLHLQSRCAPDKLHIKHSGKVPKDNRLQNGDFLRVFPYVKEIKMMNIGIGKPLLKELAKRTDRQDCNATVLKKRPLCPQVEVLELDMTHVDRNEKLAYKTLLRRVVKARGLRSMKCIWDKDGEWEEFVSCVIAALG
jgi:hypothetical protein